MKRILFTSEAEADVEEAFRWYEAQRPGLGTRFRRAIDLAVTAIESRPEAYAILYRNTRCQLLSKFPYALEGLAKPPPPLAGEGRVGVSVAARRDRPHPTSPR